MWCPFHLSKEAASSISKKLLEITTMPQSTAMPDPSQILNSVPDGKTIPFSQFAAGPGSAVAKFVAFAQPTTVSRAGNKLTVAVTSGKSTQQGGATVTTTASQVVFSLVVSGKNFTLDGITGLKASASGFGGDLRRVAVVTLANTNLQVTVTVHLPIVGDHDVTFVVDANGNVVK
jgi:hypothetical protein